VLVASLSSSVTSFVGNHGVYAVFLLMMIDAVFPAASELVMISAGALAAGAFSTESISLFGIQIDSPFWIYVTLSLAGTLGYLVGSLIGWGIGARAGRPFLERHGRFVHLTPEKLDRAEDWFERKGDWAVFLGRLTPVVRSFVSIPAGIARMRLDSYTVLTLFGSAIWCFAFAGVGWALGTSYETFHHDFGYVEIAVVVFAVGALGYWLYRRRRSRKIGARAADPTL
jgi:membrane protein DedA with SNARE-associated domain